MSKDFDSLREKLLRELGDSKNHKHEEHHWKDELRNFLELEDSIFLRLGLDLAVMLAVLGDWAEARLCIRRLRNLDSSNVGAMIFEMRCLYELESFTEVLALGQTPMSEKHHLLSANYLMAMSFEALEMFPQARTRYEAVIRQDASFLDASLRLSKLQGFIAR